MREKDTKPYTKEEICRFLDFLFLTYLGQQSIRKSIDIISIYRDFEITPITDRMIGSLANLDFREKEKKTNDKS